MSERKILKRRKSEPNPDGFDPKMGQMIWIQTGDLIQKA